MTRDAEIEKLSSIILSEFGRVHERFDASDMQISNLVSEIGRIHRRLDSLGETVGNVSGFAKEIDHLLNRIGAIEKHLGLSSHIKA